LEEETGMWILGRTFIAENLTENLAIDSEPHSVEVQLAYILSQYIFISGVAAVHAQSLGFWMPEMPGGTVR
jgi:hypothetical protein